MKARGIMGMRHRAGGFTLVELLIVVAVIAILASIAYPAYQDYVRRANRAVAKADLLEYAQRAERWHTVNNTYVGFDTGPGAPATFSPREIGATPRYTLTYTVAANSFTITATPVAGSTQASDSCGTLGISHTGRKTNSSGSLAECW